MDIFEYLKESKPSYQLGLTILKKHHPKCSVMMLLELGISKTNTQLLRVELQKIADQILVEKQKEIEKAKDVYNVVIENDKDAFEVIKKINKTEFARVSRVFQYQLKGGSTAKIRYEAAKQIIDTFEKVIVPTQKDLQYYDEHKKLPDDHYLKKSLDVKSPNLFQRKLNLRSYISKYKNDPTKAAQVAKYKIELQTILKDEHVD